MSEDGTADVGDQISEAMTATFGPAHPSVVFSEPITAGSDIVFTASAWERSGGFGFGSGRGPDTPEVSGGGGGGGGGGVSQGRPVAVIRIGDEGLQVEPVIDLTKIAVTALLATLGVWKVLRS